MHLIRLWNWTAKRSGAAITVEGVDASDKRVKIKVSTIASGLRGALPTCQDELGQYYELA